MDVVHSVLGKDWHQVTARVTEIQLFVFYIQSEGDGLLMAT